MRKGGETSMFDLEQVVRERHWTRMFLPQSVPRPLVNEALALAECAPSNSKHSDLADGIRVRGTEYPAPAQVVRTLPGRTGR